MSGPPTGIVILGAAGDGLVVAEAVRQAAAAGRGIGLAGWLDDGRRPGETIFGAPVLGGLRDWTRLAADFGFMAALHKIKQMASRRRLIDSLGIPRERWVSVVHPSAIIAAGVEIGTGAFVGQNVVVQPAARFGDHVSIRAGANIGHDAVCASYVYIGPNATLCGKARVEEGAHIGPNSVVTDGQCVERYAVVGAATAVTKRVPEFEIHLGVPARHVGGIPRPQDLEPSR